ncbi:hypothetical protein [Pseudomonas azotoformans]|uniref:hypothetical protein n=1 Tax=Pseudomonas azotoformans TaxID=47878 RepID=UPI000AF631B2|nr:hypothetical protein [Pseudomonas azotoformans]
MVMQIRSRNFSRSTSVLGSASVLALSLAVLAGCSDQAAENAGCQRGARAGQDD